MFDDVLVERVGAQVFLGRAQPKLLPRNKPKERSFSQADRAIAGHHLRKLTLNLEGDSPTMATTFVNHDLTPFELSVSSGLHYLKPCQRQAVEIGEHLSRTAAHGPAERAVAGIEE